MKLDRLFTSHMVFARDKEIRIWGEGDGEADITFAGEKKRVTSENGKWLVTFSPMREGGPHTLVFSHNGQETRLDDIYVGEVWLFAGQSNMAFKLCESTTPKDRYLSCDKLRYYSVDKIATNDRFSAEDGWVISDSETVGFWSALGYLVSHEIAVTKNVAVGAVNSNQGASVIESWVPAGEFEKHGITIPLNKKGINHTHEPYQKWNRDGALFEKQLSPLFPFSLTGVVWYQGESDSTLDEALVYDKEVSILIDVWRERFHDPDLPFYVVQIADYEKSSGGVEAWKMLQDAQLRIPDLTHNTRVVVSRDVCENNDIHPPTKDKLAARIAKTIIENEKAVF